MGEIAAGEVGRRIGFFPGDVVEDFVAELLHGEADAVDDVGVPVTQMVPLGLRTRWQRLARRVEFVVGVPGRGICPSRPCPRLTILPAWQVMPPLERK